jgi:protein-L-isoaspartate(D-aspartate) O-methyltransferase
VKVADAGRHVRFRDPRAPLGVWLIISVGTRAEKVFEFESGRGVRRKAGKYMKGSCVALPLSLLLLATPAGGGCATRPGPQQARSEAAKRAEGEYRGERERMVEEDIRARGIENSSVLRAMRKVPRHLFVPEELRRHAYADRPLPIGLEQTISQPAIVAYMTAAARVSKKDKVLEIGTGSGYQAAILGELAREVYTIEIIPELAERAGGVLKELGYANVFTRTGNGYLGWPEQAPFDAIVVTAAPDEIPQALVDQLAVGGRMVIPVGKGDQEMVIVEKTKKGVTKRTTIPVRKGLTSTRSLRATISRPTITSAFSTENSSSLKTRTAHF